MPCTSSPPPEWAGHPHTEGGRTRNGLDRERAMRAGGRGSARPLASAAHPPGTAASGTCLGGPWSRGPWSRGPRPSEGAGDTHRLPAAVADLESARPRRACRVKCVCNGIICYLSAAQRPCMKNSAEERMKRSVCQQPVERRKGCC